MIVGTLVSAAVIACGLAWYLSVHSGQPPGDHIFSGEPIYFRNPLDMFQRAVELHAHGERLSLAMVGIFLLLLSPPIRVALAGVGFLMERNRLYAGITGIVLMVLLISFFW